MATIKSYTDISQSKKLVEILPLESADMEYMFFKRDSSKVSNIPFVKNDEEPEWPDDSSYDFIPCWSLAALRNLLPPAIKPNKDSYLFIFESHNTFDKSWVYRYYNEDDTSYLYYKDINEVDACYEMIMRLNELNLL